MDEQLLVEKESKAIPLFTWHIDLHFYTGKFVTNNHYLKYISKNDGFLVNQTVLAVLVLSLIEILCSAHVFETIWNLEQVNGIV